MQAVKALAWPCCKVRIMIDSSLYPIAFGSKTLTSAETRYANIERELLGVVGALEKFHYLYIWASSGHIN